VIASGTDAAADRLARLERAQRRTGSVVVILCLLVTLALAWQFLPLRGTIEARRLVVRGLGGTARAEISEWADGSIALRLNDRDGKARGLWRLKSDGSQLFYLSDSIGHRRAEVALDPDGAPTLSLADDAGRTRAVLKPPGASGGPGLALRDGAGRTLFVAP
jgi:hypothetical protein